MTSERKSVLVGDVMTRKVRTASPGQAMTEIMDFFVDAACHHIPIVDEGRAVGIISTSDVVELVRRKGTRDGARDSLESAVAGDVMTTELETILESESVDRAIDRIGRGEYHALLVLDENEGVSGIVTHRDLLHYLVS